MKAEHAARWRLLVERLGGTRLGARPTTTWATLPSIIATLSDLAQQVPDSVLVFPSGDHLTFSSASVSRHAGWIELRCASDVTIARPSSLKLEVLTPDPAATLAYFRLETAPLGARPFDPHTTYVRTSGATPLHSVQDPRRFAGAFLLVSACSPYLRNSDVIAGVHNSLPAPRFREVLGLLARRLAPSPHGTPAMG